MEEEPTVQPMLQPGLQIEHAAFVTPGLDFFHASAIAFRDAQLDQPEYVVGKARVAQPVTLAAVRAKVGPDLALDKFDEHSF